MELSFKSKKLARICSTGSEMSRTFGPVQAAKLKQRLAELWAAETLADISHLPPARLHELIGNKAGMFSVDLVHPYRLLFAPEEPVPVKAGGGIDKAAVRSIVILAIEDTH